jgi:hypothetical protein
MNESDEETLPVRDRIRRLIDGQPYAVLCTGDSAGVHASLVAFAASDDLGAVVFATPIDTRKYRLLTASGNVAVLIDSRSGSPDDLMGIEAVTATGRARAVPAGPEFDDFSHLLIARHPHLADFVRAPSSALIGVEVLRYSHVGRFQEVREWVPGRVS